MNKIARLLSVLALAFAACHPRPSSPTSILEEAARSATSPNADARSTALAGFHAWLVDGNADTAKERFDGALARQAADPWALYGQLLMADRIGHPETALNAALQLVEQAPTHPLSAAAARRILERIGTSPELDDRILVGSRRALAAGARGDTAWMLRSAQAFILGTRGEDEGMAKTREAAGVVSTWTVLGPFSAYDVLEFDSTTPPEQSGAVDGPFPGPWGQIAPRTVSFVDGRFSLAGEPSRGDLYVLAVDLEVKDGADYVVRSITSSPHKVYLDGTRLFERRAFARSESTVSAAGVKLSPGRHRLVVKLSRDDTSGDLSVSVLRADGAPAAIAFGPAKGAAAQWTGVERTSSALAGIYPEPADFAAALEPEVGAALARFAAIEDGMNRAPDAAKRLMSELEAQLPSSPAVMGLRARLALDDRTVPSRVARGRATRDLESLLAADPKNVAALLARGQLALEDGRQIDAAEWLKRARAAHSPAGWPVLLLQTRLDLQTGVDATVDETAKALLQQQPGFCEAVALRYDLARRRDAVTLADELIAQLGSCPGALSRVAEHARTRGRLDEAIATYERLVKRDPAHVPSANGLVGLYFAAKRYDDAIRTLGELRKLWPRNTALAVRLADALEYAGRPDQALAVREQALTIDGGNLGLRRAVHRARTGRELLEDYAIDGREAIRRYASSGVPEEGNYAFVLDSAAVQVFPDGSMVDRIHTIQRATSQDGVSDIGEVKVPEGAEVLTLRTIKKDGTVLEPETIEHKDTLSMPAIEVGDYVEFEYLQAHPSRGPAQPGFTASSFYFQLANVPNAWATYTVVAPKDLKLVVEARNMTVGEPKVVGDQQVFHHEVRNMAPWISEPDSPPSPDEFLPHVTVGAGATGNEGLVSLYSDAFYGRGRLTWEVEAFAREAAKGKQGREAVEAVYTAVMQRLSGNDAGLAGSAAQSLALDRGSRLWTTKTALEALGLPTRIAAVRTFSTDAGDKALPDESLLSYVGLRVELPEGQVVWLDTSTRFAPFGELPEQARGREAWLFPEPGRPLAKVTTPASGEASPKQVELELELRPDGVLTGAGVERFTGFEAAQLSEALENLSPDQRQQALQSALSRFYGGAELEKLELTLQDKVGGELIIRYQFKAPRFARAEGERLVFGAVGYPEMLGRRYVQRGRRDSPLYIGRTERSITRVKLKMPDGYSLNDPLGEVKIADDFGQFIRRERQEGKVLLVEEEFLLNMRRVPTAKYEKFSHFAGQVDLLQTRDLLLEKR